MTRLESRRFAERWIREWNCRNLEAVLLHYADEICFSTRYAKAITGSSLVKGKDALRAYWSAGLERAEMSFVLRDVLFDEGSQVLAILYLALINGETMYACEVMRFNSVGSIVVSEAYYGARASSGPTEQLSPGSAR